MKKAVKIKAFLYTLLAVFRMRKWSNWVDTGPFEVNGKYYLMQMRYDKETNQKQFKQRPMGWVNDYVNAPKLFENALKYNTKKREDRKFNTTGSEKNYSILDVSELLIDFWAELPQLKKKYLLPEQQQQMVREFLEF